MFTNTLSVNSSKPLTNDCIRANEHDIIGLGRKPKLEQEVGEVIDCH